MAKKEYHGLRDGKGNPTRLQKGDIFWFRISRRILSIARPAKSDVYAVARPAINGIYESLCWGNSDDKLILNFIKNKSDLCRVLKAIAMSGGFTVTQTAKFRRSDYWIFEVI